MQYARISGLHYSFIHGNILFLEYEDKDSRRSQVGLITANMEGKPRSGDLSTYYKFLGVLQQHTGILMDPEVLMIYDINNYFLLLSYTLEPHYNAHFGVHSDTSVITEQPYSESLIHKKYRQWKLCL